jgi:hypothetical protein
MCHGQRSEGYASTSAAVFPFQAHNAEPSGKSWSDRHSLAFFQHLLQLTVTDAVFAVPAYGPQNDVTLKMPAFEWVHVQLHQQKGMISLSPPTICNSAGNLPADLVTQASASISETIQVVNSLGGDEHTEQRQTGLFCLT